MPAGGAAIRGTPVHVHAGGAMLSRTRAAKTLFGLVIAGALGFGATEVAASARGTATCPFDLQSGYIGACQSQSHCESGCAWYYPENGGTGMCRNGCCLCAT
jgi:hypothetical protein